jgi:hypothetical protein
MENKNNRFKYPFVSIIFPNFNGRNDTLECIDSLGNLDYPKDKLEIIITDNGSNDGSQIAIKEKFKKISNLGWYKLLLLENKENKGAVEAYNRAIKNAYDRYDYVWKLDNDVVLDSKSLFYLINLSESDKKIGVTGSKDYYNDERHTIWSAGGKVSYFRGSVRNIGVDEEDKKQYDDIKDVDYVGGCSLLIKKGVINRIGLLDKNYFVYFDETDWCIETAKAGYRVIYQPKSIVYHKVSRTTKPNSPFYIYYFTRNNLYFMKKQAKWYHWLVFIPYYVVKSLIYLIYWRIKGLDKHSERSKMFFRSVSDFLNNKMEKQI